METLPAGLTGHPAAPPPVPRGPRATLWLLRSLALLFLLAVLAQPVFAGLYLSGDWDALALHSGNAVVVESLGFFLTVAGLLYWLAGRGRGRVALCCAALWFVAEMQAGFGYARMLGLHVPLGVTVVTVSVLFTVWVFRVGARVPRRPWRGAR